MKNKKSFLATAAILSLGVCANAQLGSAGTFAVLAGTTVTNTGNTVISGDLGVWSGTAVTGFGPGVVTHGSIHAGDSVAQQAQTDLTSAYNAVAGETHTQDLSGQNLAGLTLFPGVYYFSSSAALDSGILHLDAQGNPNARFDFQIVSTLTTTGPASFDLINGASNQNVYFQVGSSATLGTGTAFQGNILALTSISLDTGASIFDGRALARNGAVTLQANHITAAPVPEPSPLITLGGCVGLGIILTRRRRK